MTTTQNMLSWLGAIAGVFSKYTISPIRNHRSERYDSIAEPYKIIHINPEEIQYYGGKFTNTPSRYGGRFSVAYYAGSEVRGGDWDLKLERINELKKHKAVEQHFQGGKKWEETGIYEYLLEKIEENDKYDGCKSRSDIVNRYQRIDDLYDSISTEGFKRTSGLDQVCVNIGRDGEIIFNGNGHHRLSIAKTLNIEDIPVRVLIRHAKWQELRKHIISASSYEELSDRAIDNLTHPDLRDVVPPSYLNIRDERA